MSSSDTSLNPLDNISLLQVAGGCSRALRVYPEGKFGGLTVSETLYAPEDCFLLS